MKNRRGSSLWGETDCLSSMIYRFEPGDIVNCVTVQQPNFIGVVREVLPKINKITVLWNGGSLKQHDPDEIMLCPYQDTLVRTRMASSRRQKASKSEKAGDSQVPSGEQFVGDPETHGINSPRGGGFSIMQDLQKDLHQEMKAESGVNPKIASEIIARIPKGDFALVQASGMDDKVLSVHKTQEEAEKAMKKRGGEPNSMFTKGMRVVDVGPKGKAEMIEVMGKLTVRPKTASDCSKIASRRGTASFFVGKGEVVSDLSLKSRRATGEMSMDSINLGGENYEWAKDIEKAAKTIQRIMKGRIRFREMRPFDVYRGPYAKMDIGKLWSGEQEGEYFLEFYMFNSNIRELSGSPEEIANGLKEIAGISVIKSSELKPRRGVVATIFPTEKSLRDYLREHPDADRSSHKVAPEGRKPWQTAKGRRDRKKRD